MASLKLNTQSGGSVTIIPTDTAQNYTISLPVSSNGSLLTSTELDAQVSAKIGVTIQAYDPDLSAWANVSTTSKQDTLVSGTNLKTVNGVSLLGSGDIGVIDIAHGGTNTNATPTAGAVVYGNGTSQAYTSVGTSGQVLISNGTLPPTWTALSTASPAYGSLAPIVYSGQPDTITSQGCTWLKTGVVAASSTYPNAPAAPYATQAPVPIDYDTPGSYSPAYGAGVWVFPYDNGVYVTNDLLTWSFVTVNANINSSAKCAFVNNLFIMFASGDYSTVWYSSNGTNWSTSTMPAAGNWCRPVWTGSRYITANSSSTNVAYSADLSTWTQVNVTDTPACVAWNGTHVVVGCNNNKIKYSTNQGTSFTSVTTSQGNAASPLTWSSIAWNGTRWVALSDNTFDSAYSYQYRWPLTTTNGASWSGTPQQTVTIYGGPLVVVGTTFYALGNPTVYSSYELFGWKSTDGSTWNSVNTNASATYKTFAPKGAASGYAAGTGNTYVVGSFLTLDAGVTWGCLGLNLGSNTAQYPARIAYGNSTYVLPLYDSNNNARHVGVSLDGINWQTRPVKVDSGGGHGIGSWYGAVYFNNKWIIGCSSGMGYYSTDLINWTSLTAGTGTPVKLNDNYVVMRQEGASTTYYYSSDGVNWTSTNLPASGGTYSNAYAYGNSTYVFTNGSSNTLYTSTTVDGSWTSRSVSFNGYPVNIFFAYSAFYIITTSGKIYKSTDNGVIWSQITPSGSALTSITWAAFDGTYIIASNDANTTQYLITSDGANWFWRKTVSSTFGPYNGIANGKISVHSMVSTSLAITGNYILNDTAQYSYVSGTTTGTQMYMRVA